MTLLELEDWAETHYDVVVYLEETYYNEDTLAHDKFEQSGTGGLQQLAFEITNKFQRLHIDTCWGVDADYMEELENFINNYEG